MYRGGGVIMMTGGGGRADRNFMSDSCKKLTFSTENRDDRGGGC